MSSPLNGLLESISESSEVARVRRIKRFLSSFHLKNTVTQSVQGRKISLNNKRVINFGSANYLGFDMHPEVIDAAISGVRNWGTHSGCSRIFSTHENLLTLERQISDLVGAEDAMVGVNVAAIHAGVIPALFGDRAAVLFVDRLAHTSIYQACLIAQSKGAQIRSTEVSDLSALKDQLSRGRAAIKVLLIDGIYSMHGHTPDLQRIQAICNDTNTILYIDDAHGIGICGARGGGVAEEFKLDYENLLLVGSLQKGLACFGGFIAAKRPIIELLKTMSTTYIFSGTLQPPAVESAIRAIEICRSEEGGRLRSQLKRMSREFRAALIVLGFEVPDGESPIVPVYIGAEVNTLMAGRKMYDLGYYLNSVLFPAVPKGEGILRVSLTASHTQDDVDGLVLAFAELKRYLHREEGMWGRLHQFREISKSLIQGDNYSGL